MNTQPEPSADCAAFRDELRCQLDGLADSGLAGHVADCDACRDWVFELEQAVETSRRAASDYVHPETFVERLLSRAREVGELSDGHDASGSSDKTAAGASDREPAANEPRTTGVAGAEADAGAATGVRPKLAPRQVRWLGIAAVAASLLSLWLARGARDAEQRPIGLVAQESAWSGRVEGLVIGRTEGAFRWCPAASDDCRSLRSGQRFDGRGTLEVPAGALASLRLDDGSALTLGAESQLRVREVRVAQLTRGRLVADVREVQGAPARIELPMGFIDVLGTKFAVHVDGDTARVDVSRGRVRLADDSGRSVTIAVGQSGTLRAGEPPRLDRVSSLASAFSWSEPAHEQSSPKQADELLPAPRGLGQLRAQKPGHDREQAGAVSLTRQHVQIRIAESMARTEIEQEFTNHSDEVLEGIYRFPLPAGAQIERLALWVDDHWEEGAFVARDRAQAIWRGAIVNSSKKRPQPRDEIVWVPGPWKDPALLEWQRGGSFELRVFPIPKRGARRIQLTYTQWLPPAGLLRRYVYPLPFDSEGSVDVDRFSIDLSVRGHSGDVSIGGYPLQDAHHPMGPSAERRFGFERRNFSPVGDLSVEFELPPEEVRAWSYDTGAERTLAVALRPELPNQSTSGDQALAIVVDRSRSMFGETYERARRLATRLSSELDPSFELTVLACDTRCDAVEARPQPVSGALLRSVDDFLRTQQQEGASDLVSALEQAGRHLERSDKPRRRIVYVGDGAPTAGPIESGWIERELRRRWSAPIPVTAVSVSASADESVLDTITRAGGGTVLRYWPGQTLGEVSYDLLSAIVAPALTDVRLEWPPGLKRVTPSHVGTIEAGAERLIVAEMSSTEVEGPLVLRGRFEGRPFERRYDLNVRATSHQGNAFVPRLFAAGRIAELERDTTDGAKREAIELSLRYNVASRHTSLLVLESPAMFRAFGLDNQRHAPVWSGDLESVATVASSSDSYSDPLYGYLDDGPSSRSGAGAGATDASSGRSRRASRAPQANAPVAEAAPAPKKKPARRCPPNDLSCALEAEPEPRWSPPPPRDTRPRPQPMVPMRRVWETSADIRPAATTLPQAELAELRRQLQHNPQSRSALAALYSGAMRIGDLEQAAELAERWSAKDPLDPDALTARADVAAQRGDRDRAIRILGSVLDVRPGDHRAAWRLARLHRWAGELEASCAFSLAVAQLQSGDPALVGEALSCARELGRSELALDLERLSPAAQRPTSPAPVRATDELLGEFRAWATWEGGRHDLDLVFIHPDGYRVSWLGAPTRAVISATDVRSLSRDGLALRGAKAGRYAVGVVRSDGDTEPVRGTLHVTFRGQRREFPFVLEGTAVRIADVNVSVRSRLVPLR